MKKLKIQKGLYDPEFEKDSCGIGFIANSKGLRSHLIVSQAIQMLNNMTHRGARSSDSNTGDGAGILIQIPHETFKREIRSFSLPERGEYGVGMLFLPKDPIAEVNYPIYFERVAQELKLRVLGWRKVPVVSAMIGLQARKSEPLIYQVFISKDSLGEKEFERKLFHLKGLAEDRIRNLPCYHLDAERMELNHFYVCSLSSQTIVYKGMLLPEQLGTYFSDLTDPDTSSAVALIHSRFSTNTFPSWDLAHPFRYICHNGEINTLRGNMNWMRARQENLGMDLLGKSKESSFPLVNDDQSDSACLDNAVELLVQGGRSLPHSLMMLVPEPWGDSTHLTPKMTGFYDYHSAFMEPWDGPAAVCFSDGKVVGAILDRNGLRPCRYQVLEDHTVILASEAGVLPTSPEKILSKGRLHPGQMLFLDLIRGRMLLDHQIKDEIASQKPYLDLAEAGRIYLDEVPEPPPTTSAKFTPADLLRLKRVFGYTEERIQRVFNPMIIQGEEPTSSMGNDTPLAVLSDQSQLLFKYFRQLFAQVTNPPIDPIRESLVMSLQTDLGPRPSLLDAEASLPRRIRLKQPVLAKNELEKIKSFPNSVLKTKTLSTLFLALGGPAEFRIALTQLRRQAYQAVRDGAQILILSDKGVNPSFAPIPSVLAVSAVHHHLIHKGLRSVVSLVMETGEALDVHHFACLIGYGAEAVHPYLVFEEIQQMELSQGFEHFTKAVNKGLLKVMSKMGISTIQSYCGAQIFEAIGIDEIVIEKYFPGTRSRIGGIDLTGIRDEVLSRHRAAFSEEKAAAAIPDGGDIHYRIQGEYHQWNPETISKLQLATRTNNLKTYQEYSDFVEQGRRFTLRGLLDFNSGLNPISIEEVEPAGEIVKRFTTGAMSFGALSKEAHETLAIAMNRIGGKSNSGEGGEDAERYRPMVNGDSKNSAIKQIASARFGVTAHYLANAHELQIKIAQGAKPGEGGQLPGHKVDETIARLRHSTAGVQLISPPPHHDIYSIEDLAQLIFDLRNANPDAKISVKLVSSLGIGTIAAGVAKAHADKILISGDSGGTGASPLSSIHYAGSPWELGIAETHQTLVLNGLRNRVRLETDGQLKTGRDVMVAALLGADEYGFSTAPLIVEGCIMMRKCHLNTCPVGVATQDPELRRKFSGQPEHVINFFFFIAEEVRQYLARLGYRSMSEIIGRSDLLSQRIAHDQKKNRGLDLSRMIQRITPPSNTQSEIIKSRAEDLNGVLDQELLRLAEPALERAQSVTIDLPIRNINRSVGTLLSGQVAKKYGAIGLPQNTILVHFNGSAGQSFGAFLSPGISLKLEGEANDYVGKGLSGGRIAVFPPKGIRDSLNCSALIGNTCLYGATSGEAFFAGVAGERFAVRNSGATSVVEGTGDHGCEYMTAGLVIVLGPTGRNFAAGMSGGIAYVYDEDGSFKSRINTSMVDLDPIHPDDDIPLLLKWIRTHFELTGSQKASMILNHWEEISRHFWKVIPTEYKQALRKQNTLFSVLQTQPVQKEVVVNG